MALAEKVALVTGAVHGGSVEMLHSNWPKKGRI